MVGSFGHWRIRQDRAEPVAVLSTDPFTVATVVATRDEHPVMADSPGAGLATDSSPNRSAALVSLVAP